MHRTPVLCAWSILVLFALPLAAEEPIAARVERLAREAAPWVVACRRDFHAHPELSNRETRTAAKVAELLRGLGFDDLQTGVAHHGVVALLRGRRPGPTIALRADMDALPITEQTGLDFASQNRGVMHACGHDAHAAMLLGTVKVLCQLRDELPGNVKFIFQPAEEGAPLGETRGAAQMIVEHVLENPPVTAIFGLHVEPHLPCGQLGCRPGGLLAAVDRFRIAVVGKQSHAATPWTGVDPVVAAAHVITALQTVTSRHSDARQPAVVSVSMVHGGTAWNILPDEVSLEGTIRTHDPAVRTALLQWFRRVVDHTAQAHGTTARIELIEEGPATWNDPELTRRMRPTLAEVVGGPAVIEVQPQMVAEDFAFYAQKIPGMFVFLGVGRPGVQEIPGLHTPQFVLDEDALPLGVRTLSLLAWDYLQQESHKATGK